MPGIVIFGAGNIGRSFIGQIFSRAGFEVVLVDVEEELVSELNRYGSYTVIHRHPDGREEQLEIAPVRAVDGRDGEAVAAALAPVQYVATSVGAAALPHVLPALAREMERRTAAAGSGASEIGAAGRKAASGRGAPGGAA
ncbi:MAG: mannitol-1-phosphate 5-dehydrogenase, partial [Spirochaetaceae bacterium]